MKRNPDYKPSERQKNCMYGMPYLGDNWDQTFCQKKLHEECIPSVDEKKAVVSNEDCENCPNYKSKFIEYPIEVSEIKCDKMEGYCMYQAGMPVRIRPCGKEYEGKTYLGMHLGEQPWYNKALYNEENKVLTIKPVTNPAIYVFALHKIIYGGNSWWSPIKNPEEFKNITDEAIDNAWYVKMLKAMVPKEEKETEKAPLTKDEKKEMASTAVKKAPEDFEPAKEVKYGRYYAFVKPFDAYLCPGGREQVAAYCICTLNESGSIFFLGSETTMGCEASEHVKKHCQEYLVDVTSFFDATEETEEDAKNMDEEDLVDVDDIPCC